ncbi:ABC transporter substrate-binding protein [Ferrovibrio sp.]|uniref:ABC transporter substrate-binding protein n=1 Tax=Ferrovibrio sp. TaxID=1917215 RepID=UPI003D2A7294
MTQHTARTHSAVTSCLRAAVIAGLSLLPLAVHAQEKIKMGTPARVNIGYSPFLLARDMGYFQQEGLEVEIIEFLGTSVLIPQVANKGVDIGFPGADAVIISRQPGRDYMPVRFFYNVTRKNPWDFVVPDNSPIKRVEDLRGKKIGVGALANGNVPIARSMFREMKMEAGRDYEFVPTGVGAPAIHAMNTGQIDVFNGFDATIAFLANAGIKLRYLQQPPKYTNLISNGMMTHEDTIKNRPEMLGKFGRAVAKAILACEADIPHCIRSAWKQYPSLKPQDKTEEQALAEAIPTVTKRMESMLTFADPKAPRRFGEYQPQMWQDYIDVLYDGGEITSKQIDVASLYTNQFVDAINAFDPAKVLADVKARR